MVIATHLHEDHIGGMEAVFERYNVKEFYMPKSTHTSKVFENMINAVANEGIKVKTIKEGMNFDLGSGAYINVYSPIYESYNNLNDYSPVMKLTFGENAFMFTGDAEAQVELEVVEKYGDDLEADVLKFGHHGSSTSSAEEFIQAVNPSYGVISSGTNNMYGHPHREVLALIDKYNIEAYRTDRDGQITLTSDGKIITVQN
jgi:competence protein ComEC